MKIKCKPGVRGSILQRAGWTYGKENKFAERFNPKTRSYLRVCTDAEIEIIVRFLREYHCQANYGVIVEEHKVWRGTFKNGLNDSYGKGQCDYFDIYLDLIRSYYLGNEIPTESRYYILKYQEFFNQFGEGEAGWRHYVKEFEFQPYLNQSYEVKDLFARPSIYQKADCSEIVGRHHGWDFALPLCSADGSEVSLLTGKERALNFALNSFWIWEARMK